MSNENLYENAIEKIRKMAVAGAEVERCTFADGKTYLIARDNDGQIQVEQLHVDEVFYPATMRVNTLTAFVNYIKAAIFNKEISEPLYINIDSPLHVSATTPVNKYGKRSMVVTAERYHFSPFNFGQAHDFENFVVALRSKFAASDGVKELLECLKSVTNENRVSTEDNGVTQVVMAKNGLHLNAAVQISPIWALKPHRTFTEIDQPESLFLLRMKQGEDTHYTLYETDGNAWAIEAMQSIAYYLQWKFEDEIKDKKIFIL